MWHTVGVSVRGTSHLEKNIPCQDAHACLLTAGGDLVLAVADGAGSAERSEEGAQAAVKQVLSSVQSLLLAGPPSTEDEWKSLILQSFTDARQSIVQLAGEVIPLRAFATTLACAVVTDDWLAVGQIGDGAVVTENEDGVLHLAVRPQRGEYANEAYFLTVPDGLSSLAVSISRQFIRSIILTSDGLLRLAFKLPAYEPSPLFFQPLLTFTAEMDDLEKARSDLAYFLNSSRVNARTDDDKTLVLATRSPCPVSVQQTSGEEK